MRWPRCDNIDYPDRHAQLAVTQVPPGEVHRCAKPRWHRMGLLLRAESVMHRCECGRPWVR
jgi:hypothetical protein